jgi:hypothetical protein
MYERYKFRGAAPSTRLGRTWQGLYPAQLEQPQKRNRQDRRTSGSRRPEKRIDMTREEQIEAAIREAEAQAAILKALRRVPIHRRKSVMDAMRLILEADTLVPGVFAAVARGLAHLPAKEE